MVAELVDAVVGGDTHRDTHTLVMVTPVGATITTLTIDNDDLGFADALVWITDHAPGPRLVIGLEGTRSFGIGLARALASTGFTVVEVERSLRAKRRRGKSDPIDAHRAAEHVLRMDADRMPTPRADGDREALRILVSARSEIAVTKTRQICRLKALLLAGDDADRMLARGALTTPRLQAVARRRGTGNDNTEVAIRRAEARRLAVAIRDAERELTANHTQLAALVDAFAPGCSSATASDQSPPHKRSCRGPTAGVAAAKPPSPHSPAPPRPRPAAARPPGTVYTAAETGT
jgi:transposase